MSVIGKGVAAQFREMVGAGELDLDQPGGGATAKRWTALAQLGRHDPVLARLGEGHADALAILAELGADPPPPGSVWGVWAAVPASVTAVRTERGWHLSGDRPWCSGAGTCTHALVTASADDGSRLFAVEVNRLLPRLPRDPAVRVRPPGQQASRPRSSPGVVVRNSRRVPTAQAYAPLLAASGTPKRP